MKVHQVSGPAPPAGPGRAALDTVLGAAAGAAGVWAMDQVGWFMLRVESAGALNRDLEARPDRDIVSAKDGGTAAAVRRLQNGSDGKGAAAGARKKATQVSGAGPVTPRPGPAATVFHYAIGVLPGAFYGRARRTRPGLRAGYGVLYGLALFVIMDETAAPLTGMASAPSRYPWQAHARGVVAHIVFGMATEAILRAADRFR